MSQKVDTFSRQNDGNPARCRSVRLCKMAKQITKSFFCLFLCAVLVFGTSYKRPVHGAATGVLLATGAVMVAGCLASMGICAAVDCVVNGKTYGQACADIWDKWVADPLKEAANRTVQLVNSTRVTFHATKDLLKSVFDGACQEIPQATTHSGTFANISDLNNYLGYDVAPVARYVDQREDGTYYIKSADELAPEIAYNQYCLMNQLESYSNFEKIAEFNVPSLVSGKYTIDLSVLGIKFADARWTSTQWTSLHVDIRRWEINNSLDATEKYKISFIANSLWHGVPYFLEGATYNAVSAYKDNERHILFFNSSRDAQVLDIMPCDTAIPVPIPESHKDVFNPSSDKFYADGKSAMNTKVDDVIDGAAEKVGVLNPDTGETEIPLTIPNVGSADDPDARSQSQSDTLKKDIADDSDRDRDRDTNKDRDTSAPKPSDIPDLSLPDVLIKKFPFSLPWDLYNSVAILVSPGEAPKWEVPFKISSMGVDEKFTLDMSQFEPLAAILRWGLSLLFLISLIILTNKLIKH